MNKQFRVAIVGCGSIAALHLTCLKEMTDIQIVAVVDIKKDRADRMASACGATAYYDMREMLVAEKPDVVHLCTPHYLHARMALEAAECNVAVFTEKPPAMNRMQWKELELASDQVPLGVCFQNRYNQNVRMTLERLRAGDFGALRGARAEVFWMRDANYYSDDWHGTWALEGGGALINQSIHTLDLMNLFIDKDVTAVRANMWNYTLEDVIEVEDSLHAFIQYGDVRAMFFATNAYSTNAPVFIELDCEQARVVLDGTSLVINWQDGRVENVEMTELSDTGFKDYWGKGHASCIQDFYLALSKGASVPIGVAQVSKTMDLVFSIYEACGRPAIADQLMVPLTR